MRGKQKRYRLKSFLFILFLTIINSVSYTQNNIPFDTKGIQNKKELKIALKTIKEGDRFYENNYYKEALLRYQKAYQFNSENASLDLKIGICYFHSSQKDTAFFFINKSYLLNKNIDKIAYYYLGKLYHLNGEWDLAKESYTNFLKQDAISEDRKKVVIKAIIDCDYAKELIKTPLDVTITNLGDKINTENPEYAPTIVTDESVIIFTSRRPTTTGGQRDPQIDDWMEDVYVSSKNMGNWQENENIGFPVNSNNHDGTVGLSNDGQTLFIYRDAPGTGGDIFICQLNGKKWSAPIPLNSPVNTKYHEPSASLSPDERTLYFVSDRPGGLGGKDIYVAKKQSDGTWGEVKNIGIPINTSGNEDAVFMHPDGKTLYFSSTGHKGMGGYDIYKSKLIDSYTWGKPENIGFPINTPDDDVFFVVSASGEHAYYSSFKKSGKGEKDIYLVTFPKEKRKEHGLTLLSGVVYDEKTNEKLEADIEIVDNETNKVMATFRSNSESGKYIVPLPAGKDYGISVNSDGYLFHSENINIPVNSGFQEIEKDIPMKPIAVGEIMVLRNIFFDYDKATLRDKSINELEKVVKLLTKYPTIKVEISGHTDSIASDLYNKRLSKFRAKAVVTYLIARDILTDRLVYKGYGESRPMAPNSNPDGTDNPIGRQLNRRVELKILSK